MQPTLEKVRGVTVVTVPGPALTAQNIAPLKQMLEGLAKAAARVVLDLSAVQFIDTAGCGLLLMGTTVLAASGGGFKVCGITQPVRAHFNLMNLQRVLDIRPTREDALRAFEVSGKSGQPDSVSLRQPLA